MRCDSLEAGATEVGDPCELGLGYWTTLRDAETAFRNQLERMLIAASLGVQLASGVH